MKRLRGDFEGTLQRLKTREKKTPGEALGTRGRSSAASVPAWDRPESPKSDDVDKADTVEGPRAELSSEGNHSPMPRGGQMSLLDLLDQDGQDGDDEKDEPAASAALRAAPIAPSGTDAGVSRYLAVARGLVGSSEVIEAAQAAAERATRAHQQVVSAAVPPRPPSAPTARRPQSVDANASIGSRSHAGPSDDSRGRPAIAKRPASATRRSVRLGRLRDALQFASDAPEDEAAQDTGSSNPGVVQPAGPSLAKARGAQANPSKPKWGLGRPMSARRKAKQQVQQ